ncbi:kinesin-like protein costa [Sitodiplosis mosellana]|uniref:kinesin-like protein costa n=1 Tax=Sitodiplosis mosellana TaxID=263140 RepID=UPI002443CA38|nr:kinesin-like protein costa [Sitodiplosis mosellana]
MEIPIQVAVRTFPCYPNELCRVETFPKYIENSNINPLDVVLSNGCDPSVEKEGVGLVQVTRSRSIEDNNGNAVDTEKSSFKIRHALPYGCSQEFIYRTTVQPMIRNFLEGYDVSIVSYGQCCTGKTYCMYGPGFDGICSELEQGIVPRAICHIFTELAKRPSGCRFSVNVAWIELIGNEIHDILGDGIIQCNNLNDVFQCLRIGFTNRNPAATHSIFTITIEQQWISPDGLLQHRLSTASFCDLVGTQRILTLNQYNEEISVPKDPGLQVLERIVMLLCDPTTLENDRNLLMNQYEETMLTRLLKDSFGGRAQTLLICCVSPLEQDVFETLENLHFAYKTQFVRNAVILNTFSDNNMPIANLIDPAVMIDPRLSKFSSYNPAADVMNKMNTANQNAPGIEFAAAQWMKLIANAEGLFSKLLMNNKTLNEDDRECIEEWMYLKQECESFGSAGVISNARLLKPIQETDENSDVDEVSNAEIMMDQEKTDISGRNATFSDNDSDAEENLEQLEAKVSELMTSFSCKINEMIEDNYRDFIDAYPNGVTTSFEDKQDDLGAGPTGSPKATTKNRRRSIQVGDSSGLSSSEIDHLNRIAEEGMRNNQQISMNNTICREATAFLENSDHLHPLRMANRHKSELMIYNDIRRLRNDIKSKEDEIDELKRIIKKEQELIKGVGESNGDRDRAKHELNKKMAALQKKKKQLIILLADSQEKKDINKYKMELSKIEIQLNEKHQLKEASQRSDKTIKEYEQDVKTRKKDLLILTKALKEDRKLLKDLEGKLKIEKIRNAKEEKKSTACVNVDTRITQLDCVLKEKSEYLHRNNDESEMVQSIRHEIWNLRKQREKLTDLQCNLNQKFKKERCTEWEARKILEYDVAKEVIDYAMEMKNQLICGRDLLNRNFVENSDLMSQLSKLNEKEMKVLLYKCFQKIVDLRESSRQLENQQLQLEQERNEWKLREQTLYNKFQQIRLKEERNTLDLQKQYETTLTMLLQKAGEDCGASSSLANESLMLPSPLHLIHPKNRHLPFGNELGFHGIHDYSGTGQQQRHSYRFANTALATSSKRDTTGPMDVYHKQKQKISLLKHIFSSNNGMKRNLSQQPMLTNYPQQTNATSEGKVTVTNKKIFIQKNKQ